MKTPLAAAIEQRRCIYLDYEGQSRTLEPYALGRNELGEDILLGRQVFPLPKDKQFWQVLELKGIRDLVVLTTDFESRQDFIEVPASLLKGIRLSI